MAKGLRSSRNKSNNLKLRSKIFGPVEDERKQRLSAKLLGLAVMPKPETKMDVRMVDKVEGMPPLDGANHNENSQLTLDPSI